MGSRCGLALTLLCLGCGNSSTLGHLSDDGGVDVARPMDAPVSADAPPPDPCVPAGTRFGRSPEAVQSATRYSLRVLSTRSVLTGTDLRIGSAITVGSSVVWAVSDDRCGVSGSDLWWGVQLGWLTREPDRPETVGRFHCLPETWSALGGRPFATAGGLGVMTLQHSFLERRSMRWYEGNFSVGAVVDEPPGFASMFNPDGRQATAQFTAREGGLDIIYHTRDTPRRFARLNTSLDPVVPPVTLGPGGDDLNAASVGPQPWEGGRLIASWSPFAGVDGGDRIEVFSEDGRVLDRWRLDERVGLTGARLLTRWMAPVECGVEFVANVGRERDVTAVYRGRLWHDGRWSLQPVASAMLVEHVTPFGRIRVATAVDPSETSISLLAFDELGALVMGPTVVGRGREIIAGDVVTMPGRAEVMVLYSSRPSETASTSAKVAVVAIDPG